MLEIQDLVVKFGGRSILKGIDLIVPCGEITAVAGPNGAGKSTMLMAVAGLVPFRGKISVNNRTLNASVPEERARQISYLPQRSALADPVEVEVVVAQGRPNYVRLRGIDADDRDIVERSMEEVGVTHLKHRLFNEISVGEQRRVLLARALAMAAPVLILDEPTAGLDIKQVLFAIMTLRELARAGKTILVVMHSLQEIVELADSAVLLRDGKKIYCGEARTVISPGPIKQVYGVSLLPDTAFGYTLVGNNDLGK